MYNGQYRSVTEVIISGDNHKLTLDVARVVKSFCDAWRYKDVKYTEHKSARKGDVLSRDILIYQNAYGHDVIILREALRCILWYFIHDGIAEIIIRETTPIDSLIE